MNMLPPKKRKENRRSQEEHQSSDETSSYTSESSPIQEEIGTVSPVSTSPTRQPSPPFSLPARPSLIPLTQSAVDSSSHDSLSESPPLSKRIKDEPEEILEVDDHNRSSEADSGVEDIKTEDDHSGHSDEDNGLKINNLDRKMHDHHQAQAMMALHQQAQAMMALHQQAQRVCRPIANRVGALPFPLFLPSPFISPTFGFSPYPRVLLPPPTIPQQPPPASPPPLAPNRPFSPRMRKLSPHRGSTIQDGNSPSRRMTRIDDSYFESQSDLGKRQKDEKLAAQLGMSPRDIERVVSMPMDEFQDYAHQKSLTEDQMNILRDIRRRGKNKVAAQNCRKRKIDQIDELQGKVVEMQKAIEKNEKIYKENRLEQPKWFESFGKLKQELEEHNREYLGCSEHPVLTKACLGTKGCEITVNLIRS